MRTTARHMAPQHHGARRDGRSIQIDVFDVIRVENGLMVEHWGVPDRLGVLSQLGLLSPRRHGNGGV